MNLQRPSCAVIVALIATQVFGPAALWAADQRGIQIEANRRVTVASLSGDQLTAQNGSDTKALHFREAVNVGDQIATGDRTVADVLIGNRAVVTLGQDTTAQFTTVSDEETTIQVSHGLVRVAAAASELGTHGIMTVQMPTGQVQTRGGIIRVLVDAPVGSAEHTPAGEARSYRATYSPNTMVAALTPRSATIQVEEGSAEILAGAGGKTMTVQAGQAVTIRSGQVGATSKFVNQAGVRAGVLATAGHSQTSKEGRDHLVALQVEQATALGKRLTGAKETGNDEADKKDNGKNAINGATGGVSLFSGGSSPQDRPGTGFGGLNNNGFKEAPLGKANVKVNGDNALLVFTRKDPVEAQLGGVSCNDNPTMCLDSNSKPLAALTFEPLKSVTSRLTVAKELVLIGGTPNDGHGVIAPRETLIVRGVENVPNTSGGTSVDTGLFPGITPTWAIDNNDLDAAKKLPPAIAGANSNFVVENPILSEISDSESPNTEGKPAQVGGTLGQFSNLPDSVGIVLVGFPGFNSHTSHVDGAITATGASVVLKGGVTLDQSTKATIGTTDATNNYYNADATSAEVTRKSTLQDLGATFTGSLLSVIDGPNNGVTTSVTVQDRLLGVYDGSTIGLGTDDTNKPLSVALLSVLDAKLKGPIGSIPLIDIAAGSHFDREGAVTPGSTPNVNVTSALVVRSTTPLALDRALLEASAPLFALTQATMTTASHFADLAGNAGNKTQAMLLNDSLVALNASTLTINGNLLNLNAATATVNGYLFSLNNGSTLTINNNGALFSLTNGSSLNLNGNAFGVFGSGANTLSIDNNLCTATCFQLVNSANQPIVLPNGAPLHVAGATHNVVLPNGFNVFAQVPGTPAPTVNIGANDALFTVDGTSTLTIKGTTVVKP